MMDVVIKILVAEAQRLMAEALRVALALEPDFAVLDEHPETGLDAVKSVVALTPDVAILDYWMSGMEGPAAIRMILKQAPKQKVVLLGWFHDPGKIRQAAEAGAWAFFSKDIRQAELIEALRRVDVGERLLKSTGSGAAAGAAEREEVWERLVALTPREIEVLSRLAASGRPNVAAKQLSVTTATLRLHIEHILAKTGARSYLEAVRMARQQGLI